MKLREPGICRVDVSQGELIGATNRNVKTFADLEGLYGNEAAFRALRREVGDISVYEVTDFKPSADAGDMIFGVTHIRPGDAGRERPSPKRRSRRNAASVAKPSS
jgi:glucose-6-phosphate isomerase